MDALDALKAAGARLTPQRVMILQAIVDAESHLTAEEIHSRVQKVYPYIDLATVYRTLQLLKRMRLVTEIDLRDGPSQFELSGNSRHHHMVCRVCRGAFDLSPHYLDSFRKTLVQEFGFEPDLHSFTISGVCVRCSPQETEEIEEAAGRIQVEH
jgi:Fe2+ or Zn2+ uptake regulation protein